MHVHVHVHVLAHVPMFPLTPQIVLGDQLLSYQHTSLIINTSGCVPVTSAPAVDIINLCSEYLSQRNFYSSLIHTEKLAVAQVP